MAFTQKIIYPGTTIDWKLTINNEGIVVSIPVTYRFQLRGATQSQSATITIGSTAPGSYVGQIPVTTTQNMGPGIYDFVATAIFPSKTIEVDRGEFVVLPTLSVSGSTTYDPRSSAERALDNVNAIIEKIGEVGSHSAGGLTYTMRNIDELTRLANWLRRNVATEKSEMNKLAGKPPSTRILSTFN